MEYLLYLMDYRIRWLIIIVIIINRWFIIIIYHNTSSTSLFFLHNWIEKNPLEKLRCVSIPKHQISLGFALFYPNLTSYTFLDIFWNYVLIWKISTIATNLTSKSTPLSISSNWQVQNLNTITTNSTQQMIISISISSLR